VAYAEQINARLVELGVRSRVDAAAERMNAKIRSAQLMKVPYMLVVGEQEAANSTVSLRKRDGSRQDGMAVDQFVDLVAGKIKSRAGDL
jgi:threonyl-tRNA synthetase